MTGREEQGQCPRRGTKHDLFPVENWSGQLRISWATLRYRRSISQHWLMVSEEAASY